LLEVSGDDEPGLEDLFLSLCRFDGEPGGVMDFQDESSLLPSLVPVVARVLMLGEGTNPLGSLA